MIYLNINKFFIFTYKTIIYNLLTMNQKQASNTDKTQNKAKLTTSTSEAELNKVSNIFETHYEKVLSIINKIKEYLKSVNQEKLLEDLIWVTKIITTRTLYTYEIKEEEGEDEEKTPKKDSAYFKFVKFVAKYNDEVIQNNRNSFIGAINAGISKSNNSNFLLRSSINLKNLDHHNNRPVSHFQEKIKYNDSLYEDKEDYSEENEEEKSNKNDLDNKNEATLNKNNNISNPKSNIDIPNISNEIKVNNKNNKNNKTNNSKIKDKILNKTDVKNKLKNPKFSTPKNFNKCITHYKKHNRFSSCTTNTINLSNEKIKPIKSAEPIITEIDDIQKRSKIINVGGINFAYPTKKKFYYGLSKNTFKANKKTKNVFNKKSSAIICKNINDHSSINQHPTINNCNRVNKKQSNPNNKPFDKLYNTRKTPTKKNKIIKKSKQTNKQHKITCSTPENKKTKDKYKKGGFFSFLNQIIVNLYGDEQNNNQNKNTEIVKKTPAFIPFKSLKEQYSNSIKNIMNKDFDIFALKEIVGYKNIMPIIGSVILDTFHLINDEIISVKKLESFLTSVSNEYLETTLYHNSMHGTDVTQTLSFFFLYSNIEEVCQTNILDLLGIFISALGHDIGHPGLTNNYHINASSDLAVTYNDISCLENFHTSLLFKVLRKDENNIFEKLTDQNYKTIRKRMISQILSTDMANHGKVMSLIKSKVDVYKLNLEEDKLNNKKFVLLSGNEKSKFDEQQSLLDFLIHSADLAHNTKAFNISLKWVELLSEEFWLQGDKEKASGLPISFLCDRTKYDIPSSQVGFIKGFVITTYDCLVTMFPTLQYTVDIAENNVKEWKKLIEQKRLKGWTPRNSKSE